LETMRRTIFIRLGGLAAMMGGVTFVAATVSLWVLVEHLSVVLADESYVAPIYVLLVLWTPWSPWRP
jgi:hypothetical protein